MAAVGGPVHPPGIDLLGFAHLTVGGAVHRDDPDFPVGVVTRQRLASRVADEAPVGRPGDPGVEDRLVSLDRTALFRSVGPDDTHQPVGPECNPVSVGRPAPPPYALGAGDHSLQSGFPVINVQRGEPRLLRKMIEEHLLAIWGDVWCRDGVEQRLWQDRPALACGQIVFLNVDLPTLEGDVD